MSIISPVRMTENYVLNLGQGASFLIKGEFVRKGTQAACISAEPGHPVPSYWPAQKAKLPRGPAHVQSPRTPHPLPKPSFNATGRWEEEAPAAPHTARSCPPAQEPCVTSFNLLPEEPHSTKRKGLLELTGQYDDLILLTEKHPRAVSGGSRAVRQLPQADRGLCVRERGTKPGRLSISVPWERTLPGGSPGR